MIMKRNGIVILSSIVLLGLGYVAGSFLGFPEKDVDSLSGDIGKMNRHKKEVVSENMKLLSKKLQTDEQFRDQTLASLMLVNSRVEEFKANAQMSVEACANIEQMKEAKAKMEELAAFSEKAATNTGDALQAITLILDGNKSADIEELTNNALLSYMLIGKSVEAAKLYVESADAFLKKNGLDNHKYLAFTRDQWADYSAVEAAFNNDGEALKYWEEQKQQLSNEEKLEMIKNVNESLNQTIIIGSIINQSALAGLAGNNPALNGLIARYSGDDALKLNNNENQLNVRDLEVLKSMNTGSLSINNNVSNSLMNISFLNIAF
jgi:hypothetical protein